MPLNLSMIIKRLTSNLTATRQLPTGMSAPKYSNDAVKYHGIVVWAENSRGTRYRGTSSGFDEKKVITLFHIGDKTLVSIILSFLIVVPSDR